MFTKQQWRENNREQNLECWDQENDEWSLICHYGDLPEEVHIRNKNWVIVLNRRGDTNSYEKNEYFWPIDENWMVRNG